MRMYTLHFGHGMEHTQIFYDMARGNLPYKFSGWDNGAGDVDGAEGINAQIVSHRELFDRYGIKGGHGEYCLETWTGSDNPPFSCQLHTGGYGDLPLGGHGKDAIGFYLKLDFMYTNTDGGDIIVLQRTKTGNGSRDFTLSISNGYLSILGSQRITQPDTDPTTYSSDAWFPRDDNNDGTIFLEPDKWHEIQIFLQPYVSWDVSQVGPDPIFTFGYNAVEAFVAAFDKFEAGGVFKTDGGETGLGSPVFPLQMELWPASGHPVRPNSMLPGQDQTVFPPENLASGQYFYGEDLGLVYVWVNGKLDIQNTANMANEQDGWIGGYSQQAIHLGYVVDGSDADDDRSGRFFYDNIILNDIRTPSGSFPSKIFNPLYSAHASLEWNPNYNLKFVAMEMDTDYWELDDLGRPDSRKHDLWLPDNPLGRLVESGEPYYIPSPNRFGAPTDRMIPHGTKLTVIHVDWNGDDQGYTTNNGNRNLYPDYDIDYAYQHIQPNESNPFATNKDDPYLRSDASGTKSLFFLKRPPATSGKQPLAGGYGLGGIKDYVPNFIADLGESGLPVIYRIWTCVQDHSVGSVSPTDTQHHMIRVPVGTGYSDYISDNQCPGDRTYRAYHDGTGSIPNGYSMADWPYNPETGDPWTWDDLDVLQIGISHEVHSSTNHVLLHTMYLVVEHATPINPEIGILGTNLLEWTVADDIPFHMQQKVMYHPGWKFNKPDKIRKYYNRWNVLPVFQIDRTDRQTLDGQATISGMQYSGTIEYDYSIRYINGDVVQGSDLRKFDEHFDKVWVYTISGYTPSNPIRYPMRGEVITDAAGKHFTFLTYPVLQWNTKKYPTDQGLSPLDRFPYIIYDYNTLYLIPFTTHEAATSLDPDTMISSWTDSNTKPTISGTWTIQKQVNAFNFSIDHDSYFHPFSPSSVANHILTHPNELLDTTFPPSRDGHDYYFQAPDLGGASAFQTIHLTDILGVSDLAIDNELYEAHIGLHQTTVDQAINDTGEGVFLFYRGNPTIDNHIYSYTFGQDAIEGWHLNEDTIIIPSGTRQVVFGFIARRKTPGPKSPGGTLGGTSNFASFDEPFFIMAMSSGYSSSEYHPADVNQDHRIGSEELATYIGLWQSGILPLGIAKTYLKRAEQIWQSGVSTYFGDASGGLYRDSGGETPENWIGSGCV